MFFPRTKTVLVHTSIQWAGYPLVKDLLWAKDDADPIDAHPPFEYVDSESTGGETSLAHHLYKTLFSDHKDVVRSVLNQDQYFKC